MSMELRTPVRVCRAAAERERSGCMYRMYAYEGLYLVTAMERCVAAALHQPRPSAAQLCPALR